MFRKTIEFSTQEDYHALKEDFPIPSVLNIPEWFKKLDHSMERKTVKGCIPFLDAISCLFTPIFNNQDDRFSPITGIVDTDSFNAEVNFPIVINGDKYPALDTVIKKGTPYVQVIPFKRENWEMVTKPISSQKLLLNKIKLHLKHLHNYKNAFWKKKKWK